MRAFPIPEDIKQEIRSILESQDMSGVAGQPTEGEHPIVVFEGLLRQLCDYSKPLDRKEADNIVDKISVILSSGYLSDKSKTEIINIVHKLASLQNDLYNVDLEYKATGKPLTVEEADKMVKEKDQLIAKNYKDPYGEKMVKQLVNELKEKPVITDEVRKYLENIISKGVVAPGEVEELVNTMKQDKEFRGISTNLIDKINYLFSQKIFDAETVNNIGVILSEMGMREDRVEKIMELVQGVITPDVVEEIKNILSESYLSADQVQSIIDHLHASGMEREDIVYDKLLEKSNKYPAMANEILSQYPDMIEHHPEYASKFLQIIINNINTLDLSESRKKWVLESLLRSDPATFENIFGPVQEQDIQENIDKENE